LSIIRFSLSNFHFQLVEMFLCYLDGFDLHKPVHCLSAGRSRQGTEVVIGRLVSDWEREQMGKRCVAVNFDVVDEIVSQRLIDLEENPDDEILNYGRML
jgi:hypothetical protein